MIRKVHKNLSFVSNFTTFPSMETMEKWKKWKSSNGKSVKIGKNNGKFLEF